MTTGQTFGNASSIAEDVTDIIFQITPEDTPFTDMIAFGEAHNTVHEWQERELTTRQVNANVQGAQYGFTTPATHPARLVNLTQIFKKEIRVSKTHVAVSHYGIDNLFADQMQLRMVEYKTDVEHAYIQGTLVSGATDTAVQLDGILNAMIVNSASYTDFDTAVTLSESLFNGLLQVGYDSGSKPRDVLGGGLVKRTVSSFAAGGERVVPHDSGRVVNTIAFYSSDFGEVQMHLSRDMPVQTISLSADLIMVDRTMAKKAMLRPVIAQRVPETGDSVDGVIVGEKTLEWGHPEGHIYAKLMHINESLI